MPKLTKRIVDATLPGPAQVFVWDSEVKGFGLRVTPAGSKAYVLNFRNAARRSRRYTIGKHGSPWTCEEARNKAVELLRGLATGADPLEAKFGSKTVTTVEELVGIDLKEGPVDKPNKKLSSWATDELNLRRHVVPLLGSRPVSSLTSADVSRLQNDIVAGRTKANVKTGHMGRAIVRGGRGTAARTVAVLGAMFEFAVRRGFLTSNPAKGVQIGKGIPRERFLTDREVAALADALRELEQTGSLTTVMANAIRLLLLTGCRRNEIRSLRWSWVDLVRGCLRLPDAKNGAKVVPLATVAVELLASLERTSQFVLPSSRNDGHIVGIQKAWVRVRTRATELARARALADGDSVDRAPDLTAVRLHDLRHSFASFAVADGASLFIVGKVLGHKQTSTTEIYSHLGDDPLRAVANRTGARIAAAMKAGTQRHEPDESQA